jgi:hypothetical protein
MHYLVERLHPAANQGRCMIVVRADSVSEIQIQVRPRYSPSDPGVTVRLFIRITYRAFFLRLTISRILAETRCLKCRRRADR